MTQSEIARNLQVSQTAVSLVLNNPATTKVSEPKKRLILNFLKKSGRLNRKQTRKTWNIGFVSDAFQDLRNDFYRQSIAGIESEADRQGYNVFIETFRGNELNLVRRSKADGLVVRSGAAFERLEKYAAELPMVLLNCATEQLRCDTVMPDNRGAIALALDHLLQLGHRRIAFLGGAPHGSPFSCNYRERLEAFRHEAERRIPEYRPEYLMQLRRKVAPDDATCAEIGRVLEQWMRLPAPPTAVIGVNHLYAAMLADRAAASGIAIPEKLSIVAGDNKTESFPAEGGLTALEQNIFEMSRLAAELLFRRIAEPERMKVRINCRAELVIRDSSAAPV